MLVRHPFFRRSMSWQQWASVAFANRQQLPMVAGIYIVADATGFVWYVGQATNLQSRWIGRSHHRYPQLIRTNKKLSHRIYWHPFAIGELDQQERLHIDLLRPELNGCKVKTYLPKQPQVEREIKRLLKALNRTTLLFPVLRSVVAGEYVDEDSVRCILTVIFINDEKLLNRSIAKRYSAEVRRAWSCVEHLCGYPAADYQPARIGTYEVGGERIEFVIGCDLLRYLEDYTEVMSRAVGKANLFGAEVVALRSIDVLAQVPLTEAFSAIGNGKQRLTCAAYLRYRKSLLIPLQGISDHLQSSVTAP